MRYLFRGLVRETGRPVEGHVEAATDAEAYNALSQNGVVTESLNADPKPLNLNDELPSAPQFADALESAFDSSSSQVDFDALNERYHGKKVWVIDRDKIRRRVAQVVDAALALSHLHDEGAHQTRERVNSAIQAMFNDNRNLASERNVDSVAGVRFNGTSPHDRGFVPPPPPPVPESRITQYLPGNGNGGGNNGGSHAGLEAQVSRMANLVKQAESTLNAIKAAARSGNFGGGGGGGGGGRGGGRRSAARAGGRSEEQNGVLLEIFKSNLALVQSLQEPAPPATPEAEPELAAAAIE